MSSLFDIGEDTVLSGHTDEVKSAMFSPDGNRVLTASKDKTAQLWDADSGETMCVFEGHRDQVSSAVFSTDGSQILTGSYDNNVRLWDAVSGAKSHVLRGHSDHCGHCEFSPDNWRVLTNSNDSTARLWDVSTGEPLHVFGAAKSFYRLSTAVMSPDGKRVIGGGQEGTVWVWDEETGEAIHTLFGHDEGIAKVFWSPDGCWILTTSVDGTAIVWDSATGDKVHGFKYDNANIEFSPDGKKLLFTESGTARITDTVTGLPIRILFKKRKNPMPKSKLLVSCIVLSSEGNSVVDSHFTPDGKKVLTQHQDGNARIWDSATGEEVHLLDGDGARISSSVLSPDSRLVLITYSAEVSARLWDLTSGERTGSFKHRFAFGSEQFTSDGSKILTISNGRSSSALSEEDPVVRIWKLDA